MYNDLMSIVGNNKHLKILKDMNILTIDDLCSNFPQRYQITEATGLVEEKTCTVEVVVLSFPKVHYGGRIPRFTLEVQYAGERTFELVVFHRKYLVNQFVLNQKITLVGKYDASKNSFVLHDVYFKPLASCRKITPIYSLRSGITQEDLNKYTINALKLISLFENKIPEIIMKKYNLMNRDDAIRKIHSPMNKDDINRSIEYIKYEQFFMFQLTMQYTKELFHQRNGLRKTFSMNKLQDFINELSFDLTPDQSMTVAELLGDFQSEKAMYRFVQGDVGSGKTVVAAIGIYASFLAGFQSAFMVPTEILAKQQFESMQQLFEPYGVRVELLTGSMTKKEREYVHGLLKQGVIDVLIGTHSLFQEKVIYNNLGFVVADEQHRFGVKQRKALKDKGEHVDFLLMSATPIPRTLAMSLYGDMDVSTIETMPLGRKGVETKLIHALSMKEILNDLTNYLDSGGQCYVICPLVDQKDISTNRDATSIFEGMSKYFEGKYSIGLLHGQMNDEDKSYVMQLFKENKIQIIVSTTVIEVGINVPNANMMVIYNAERFGLSQLHQLRGRIGRGSEKGFCYLLSSNQEPSVIEKLQFIEKCNNGFELSRFDLQRRGPGDMLGDRQSGIPSFSYSDIYKDAGILEQARNDVRVLFTTECKDEVFIRQLELIEEGIKKNNQYID